MGSSTEVEQDDFKTAVEQFAKQMKEVVREIDDVVKLHQQQAAKNLEAAQIENSLVFQIDNEPISGVDTLAANLNSFSQSSSIALASQASKQKRETKPTNYPSVDIMLLTTGYKKAITILANAYCACQSQLFEPSVVPVATTEALKKRLD